MRLEAEGRARAKREEAGCTQDLHGNVCTSLSGAPRLQSRDVQSRLRARGDKAFRARIQSPSTGWGGGRCDRCDGWTAMVPSRGHAAYLKQKWRCGGE